MESQACIYAMILKEYIILRMTDQKITNLKIQHNQKVEKNATESQKEHKKYRRWNKQENLIYAQFLKDQEESFACQFERRSNKVFLKLSQLMDGKKKTSQCKSHHQKMLKVYGSCQSIVNKFLPARPQQQSKKIKENLIIIQKDKKQKVRDQQEQKDQVKIQHQESTYQFTHIISKPIEFSNKPTSIESKANQQELAFLELKI